MTQRTAAARYARALFDVALKEQADLSRIESDLASFHDLLTSHAELKKVLLNPAVPVPRKRAAVEALLARAGVVPVVGKLLLLLAERDRLVLLPELLESYRQRLLDRQHVVRAEVTTAEPLDAARLQVIEHGLAKATGRTVRLSTRVAPEILGGLVAKVGSTVYDGSISHHLRRMKQRLEKSL